MTQTLETGLPRCAEPTATIVDDAAIIIKNLVIIQFHHEVEKRVR